MTDVRFYTDRRPTANGGDVADRLRKGRRSPPRKRRRWRSQVRRSTQGKTRFVASFCSVINPRGHRCFIVSSNFYRITDIFDKFFCRESRVHLLFRATSKLNSFLLAPYCHYSGARFKLSPGVEVNATAMLKSAQELSAIAGLVPKEAKLRKKWAIDFYVKANSHWDCDWDKEVCAIWHVTTDLHSYDLSSEYMCALRKSQDG